MVFTRSSFRTIAVAGTTAAFAVGTALMAVPASAATAAPLTYTCDAPAGPYEFKVNADTTLPATATAGAALSGSLTYDVVIPDALRNLMYSVVNARFVEGTATIQTTAFGTPLSLAGSVPKTPVPAAGDLTVVSTSALAVTAPTAAGAYNIVAGDFKTLIKLTKDEQGTPGDFISEVDVDCKLNAGQNAVIDTVAVTAAPVVTPPVVTPPVVAKQASTTTAKVKFAKKSKKATVKVSVKGADGTAGTGKVKVKVKIGKKTKTVSATLNAAGKAKAVFKKIAKKGTYKFKVAYAGSDTQNASKAKATLKVK